jgi:SAM-dependent methyltransferase
MAYSYQDDRRDDILRMIPPDGQTIGSIGCGYAATEFELVKQGRQVHGVDVAPEAIEVARTRLTSARLIAPDNWDPFEPDSLDGLILADVIEHIPKAWEALRHFARAIKPGGWVVISVPNMRNFEVMLRFALGGDWPEAPTGIFDARLKVERWFTRYDPRGPRRQWFFPLCDKITLHVFKSWWMFQIECRCRRPA